MTKSCPKCVRNRIAGPFYVNNGCQERLKYVCLTCGYASYEPCADAQDPQLNKDIKTWLQKASSFPKTKFQV